jgi:hypothetical protein
VLSVNSGNCMPRQRCGQLKQQSPCCKPLSDPMPHQQTTMLPPHLHAQVSQQAADCKELHEQDACRRTLPKPLPAIHTTALAPHLHAQVPQQAAGAAGCMLPIPTAEPVLATDDSNHPHLHAQVASSTAAAGCMTFARTRANATDTTALAPHLHAHVSQQAAGCKELHEQDARC